jgi:hypothetical protein
MATHVTGEMTIRCNQEVTVSADTHRIETQGMAIHVTEGMARRIYIDIRTVVIMVSNKDIVSTVITIITTLVNADD